MPGVCQNAINPYLLLQQFLGILKKKKKKGEKTPHAITFWLEILIKEQIILAAHNHLELRGFFAPFGKHFFSFLLPLCFICR